MPRRRILYTLGAPNMLLMLELISLLAAASIVDATPKLTAPDAATYWQRRDVAVAHAPAAAAAAANRETKMLTTTLSTLHKCESDSSGWHVVTEDRHQVDTRSNMNFTGIEMLHRPHAKGSPTLMSQFYASLRLTVRVHLQKIPASPIPWSSS